MVVLSIQNYINGSFQAPLESSPSSSSSLEVTNPATGDVIARVGVSSAKDVDAAVRAASAAFPNWRDSYTVKARAAVLLRFHALVQEHADELADLIVRENGKNKTEALADVAKGNETVEYACNLPALAAGRTLQVSGAVSCQDRRVPLGVVANIVPFNFPFMVPFWTIPIALVLGNTVVCKPSEKVPLTMNRVATLMAEAGLPPGCLNLVQGSKETVEAIIQHPTVQAVTFVGSSPVAAAVSLQCRQLQKRCTALGGAKNHLVALPDCEIEGAASDITVSFAGCAGQRCMAASVLLVVGQQPELLQRIVEKSSLIQPGTGPGQMGPVIDKASYEKITSYIALAEQDGAKVLLDGRSWKRDAGNWIGPTILLHQSANDRTVKDEVFGPVLSVVQVSSWEEAVAIENASPFGNAASVYTVSGGAADWFCQRFRAAMLGVNIGIPVPREPFSFGGMYGTRSKFGDMDITGDGAMEFFSHRIKISSKWPAVNTAATIQNGGQNGGRSNSNVDRANFAGSM